MLFSTSSVGTLWVCSYFGRFVWGAILDQKGHPFGHPSGCLSFMHAFVYIGSQFVMDGCEFFKTIICVQHLRQGFSNSVFFSVVLSTSRCLSTLGHSSSIRNSISMLFINSAFCDLFFPIFCSKFFCLDSIQLRYIITHSPQLVDKIFFPCFRNSYLVCIIWPCLGIFLLFYLSLLQLLFTLLRFFSPLRYSMVSSRVWVTASLLKSPGFFLVF